MAKRTVEESSLTMVADAIREGTGTSDPLVFPEGFVAGVDCMSKAVMYTEQTLTEEQKAQARANIGLAVVEPSEDDIPKVFFTGTAPTTKAEDELPLVMEYHSKTLSFKDYVTLKVQGDSSAKYPKKNFNLKMFSDADRTEKDKRVFRDWSKTHKYCLKANWIDHTHARNVVNGRLWGQVVRSRSDYAEYPAEYRESANCGAVNGFPVKVYINGIYQGIYTWNIRKDESMFNMDDSTGTQAALIADAPNNVTLWRELPAIDGTDWTDELNDTVPDAVKTSFRNLYTFVMESTDEEFKANIGNYFYLSSLIDYYIFAHTILLIGGFGKTQTVFTYDCNKWLANIYDMDTSWALAWDGSEIHGVNWNVSYSGTGDDSNLLYCRLSTLFADEIKTRYAELRSGVLSVANIINEFERFVDVISSDLYAEDYASTTANGAFVDIPLSDTNNLQKLREIIVERLAFCDVIIPNGDPTLLYKLAEETAFDGTEATIIDTGVLLFDEPKDFTVLVDFTDGDASVGGVILAATGPGADASTILVKTRPNERYGSIFYLGGDVSFVDDVRAKIAVSFVGGVISDMYFSFAGDGDAIQRDVSNASGFAAHERPLYLGGFKYSDVDYWREMFTGTIHSLVVYNYAMTSDELTAFVTDW